MRISDWSSDVCSSDLSPRASEPERPSPALPITATCNGRSFSNSMLITHRGISGPAILQISSYWQPGDTLLLDLLPGSDALQTLQALQAERPAAELKTLLAELLPKRLAQRLCRSEEQTSELQSLMRNSYAVYCLK